MIISPKKRTTMYSVCVCVCVCVCDFAFVSHTGLYEVVRTPRINSECYNGFTVFSVYCRSGRGG